MAMQSSVRATAARNTLQRLVAWDARMLGKVARIARGDGAGQYRIWRVTALGSVWRWERRYKPGTLVRQTVCWRWATLTEEHDNDAPESQT